MRQRTVIDLLDLHRPAHPQAPRRTHPPGTQRTAFSPASAASPPPSHSTINCDTPPAPSSPPAPHRAQPRREQSNETVGVNPRRLGWSVLLRRRPSRVSHLTKQPAGIRHPPGPLPPYRWRTPQPLPARAPIPIPSTRLFGQPSGSDPPTPTRPRNQPASPLRSPIRPICHGTSAVDRVAAGWRRPEP